MLASIRLVGAHTCSSARFNLGLFGFVGVILGLGAAVWKQTEPARPMLELSTEVLTFGAVPVGKEISRSVKISNRGDVDLVISRVQTGCGCTKVGLRPSNRIAPGRTATLDVSIELDHQASFNGKVATVFVFSNDPARPVVRLIANANPSAADSGVPEVIDFGLIEASHLPVSRELIIRRNPRNLIAPIWEVLESHDTPEVQLDKVTGLVSAPLKEFRAETPGDVASSRNSSVPPGTRETHTMDTALGAEQRYRVTWSRSMPTGDVYALLKVRESRSGVCSTVVLRGHVRGRLVALPQMVAIGPLYDYDTSACEVVKIRRSGGISEGLEPEMVRKALVSDNLKGMLQYDFRKDERNGHLLMAVTVAPGQTGHASMSQQLVGFLRLEIGIDGEYEWLNVPISIVTKVRRIREE